MSAKADVESAAHALNAGITEFEHRLDLKIDRLEHKFDMKIAALQSEQRVMKWMMGFILAFQVAIFVKLFLH